MRIAQVAPLFETVPPTGYGGTERVIAALCDELVAAGHEVTLFAAAGSTTAAHLEPMSAGPLRTSMSREELVEISPHLHLRMLADVYRRAGDFDVVHAHTDIWTLPLAQDARTSTVITMHGRLDLDAVQRVFPLYPEMPLVSVSDAQRAPMDHFPLRWMATCHNGLNLDGYLAERARRGDYLCFVGRLTPEKRPDLAVQIAARCGLRLRVAAKVDPLDVDYFDNVVAPLFATHDVDFVGEIGEAAKPGFYAGAKALLFPIDWPEPFGLVMIESLAAGTPVIALDRGSVREVLTDGVSGAICHTVDEMVDAVARIDDLSADSCRAEARRFTAASMAARYVEVYDRLLQDAGARSAAPRTANR